MIEDIEGATSEPTRRRHVIALSSAITSISLVLLVALVAIPFDTFAAPQRVVPAASPGVARAMTVTFMSNPISQLRLDLTRDSLCTAGTRLIPPYFISVDATTGDLFAVRSVAGTSRAVPVRVVADARTPWFSVTCATPDRGNDH